MRRMNNWSCLKCRGAGGRYGKRKWLPCFHCSGTGNRRAKPGKVKVHKTCPPRMDEDNIVRVDCPPPSMVPSADSPVRPSRYEGDAPAPAPTDAAPRLPFAEEAA